MTWRNINNIFNYSFRWIEISLFSIYFLHWLYFFINPGNHFIKMEHQSIQICEQQKASWNKFSSGWKKRDELNMGFLNSARGHIHVVFRIKKTRFVCRLTMCLDIVYILNIWILLKGKTSGVSTWMVCEMECILLPLRKRVPKCNVSDSQ